MARPRLALVLDPRFPGGTASAVAAEIRALDAHVELSLFALDTAMFRGRAVNPTLQAALDAHGIEPIWDARVIRSEIVVFHNPSCLRFNRKLDIRITCDLAFVVTQENFLRPNGVEGFDVGQCLALTEAALVARRRYLAPVSPGNRRGVVDWLGRSGADWPVAEPDWVSICDLPMRPPNPAPRDRRGRHSRPGFEKFPDLATMVAHFPPTAESCTILGGDGFLLDPGSLPAHWRVLRFGEIEVARFLDELDFFVYFTHPLWRESFGRVIFEAIAAGKLVITDPATAEPFGSAVVASDGDDVDALVARYLADPAEYGAFVRRAQAHLARFGPEAFAAQVLAAVVREGEAGDALV